MNTKKKKQTIAAMMAFAAIMMLVALPTTSVVGMQLSETMKNSESPLYHIRTNNAVKENQKEKKEPFQRVYIGGSRLLVPPLLKLQKNSESTIIQYIKCWSTAKCYYTESLRCKSKLN